MRCIARILLLSVSLAATFAYSQNKPNTPFQHVIIVIQENRTPDNLFGSDAFANPHQLPGADLSQTGQCYNVAPYTVALQSINLGNTCNPDHSHKPAWITTYNNGAMDGACKIAVGTCKNMSYPEYTYVQSSDVAPYFQIAEQYGYANYMFQTNQGPSFPAHQFLLSGTSAPIYNDGDNMNYWQWFTAENATAMGAPYGCTATTTIVKDVNPSGDESGEYNKGFPCYNHNTLVNLLENPPSPIQPLSWKYYSHATTLTSSTATSLWTAPNAITGICMPEPIPGSGIVCQGSDWNNYVKSVFPDEPGGNYSKSFSPILTDLGADTNQPQCALPAVSWVVPDGKWSDHANEDTDNGGPSWVTAIVNAVGGHDNAGNLLQKQCTNPDGTSYWDTTAIIITWDDWGGWYDHVLPWRCNSSGTCTGYNNGQQGVGGEYVYGFRVPLLVVSAYTPKGYLSGALPPYGQGKVQPYVHDFGSILNFIEYAFGENQKSLGEIYPEYHYADYYAPDSPNVQGCNQTLCPYSLADFFPSFTSARTFTPIVLNTGYTTQCFITPNAQGCFGSNFQASDPDADAVDPD